jgi:hypothetical protein
MPVHVLAGHLVIIAAPISVLLALVYALRPAARAGMRWPLLISAVLSFGLAVWAEQAGSALFDQVKQAPAGPAQAAEIAQAYLHVKAGDLLTVTTLVLAVLVVVLVFWRLSPARTAAGGPHRIASGLLVIAALAVAWYTADTLVLGMQAVWSEQASSAVRS